MDSTTLSPDKVELATITRNEDKDQVTHASWVLHDTYCSQSRAETVFDSTKDQRQS